MSAALHVHPVGWQPTWDEPAGFLADGSYVMATHEWLLGTYGTCEEAERDALAEAVAAKVLAALDARTPVAPATPVAAPDAADKALASFLEEFGYELDDS